MTNKTGKCGGYFFTPDGILTSPSFPDKYPNYADCYYYISQPTGSQIKLNFHTLDIEAKEDCPYDYLEIRDGSDGDSPLVDVFCGDEIPHDVQSSLNNLWIR